MDSFVAAPAELALLAACLKKKSYKSLELVARDSQAICTWFFPYKVPHVQGDCREETRRAYFCLKWAFWAARPVMKKIAGCELWATFKGCFFMFSWAKFFKFFFYIVGSALKSCLIEKWDFFFILGKYFWGVKKCFFSGYVAVLVLE